MPQKTHIYMEMIVVLLYSSRTAYYGIFDGHAGPKASQFAVDNLHKNIVSRFPKGSSGRVDITS